MLDAAGCSLREAAAIARSRTSNLAMPPQDAAPRPYASSMCRRRCHASAPRAIASPRHRALPPRLYAAGQLQHLPCVAACAGAESRSELPYDLRGYVRG
jgi:hypothetical protein